MKRFTVILLCFALIAGCICSATAALAPLQIGDVDRSYDLDIIDATLIQRFIADITAPTELQVALADVDADGDMTILDATIIQRKLADIPCNFVGGEIYDYYIGDKSFHNTAEIQDAKAYGSYSSDGDVCYVGVPVTFTAEVRWGAQPRSYQLFIDGVMVEEKAANGYQRCDFTTTFKKAGTHSVVTKINCKYGVSADHTDTIVVQNLPGDGKPVIMGATFFGASEMSSGDGMLTVTAAGGSGSYQYQYVIQETTSGGEYYSDIPYCDSNEVLVLTLEGPYGEPYGGYGDGAVVTVTVRDGNGGISDPVTVKYYGYQMVA